MPSGLERLAIVETKVGTIGDDVKEIKADVKSLLTTRDGGSGVFSVLTKAAPWAAVCMAAIAIIAK